MRARALVLVVLAALGCRGPAPSADRASCAHLRAERTLHGVNLCEDVWSCTRPPDGPWDRVGLRRIAPCDGPTGPVVLYLPGMHMNADLPVDDPRHDLRLFLAVRGARCWGLDYRTHAVPPDTDPAQLGPLTRWTAGVFADDAVWALRFVRGLDGGPVHLAGFSHGGALAYLVATRDSEPLGGLVVLDGALPSGRPPRGGGPAIDVAGRGLPFELRRRLLEAVSADPDGPSPLPGHASAGAALAHVLWSASSFGGRGGLANTRAGVSDLRVLARLLASYDRWWPRATLGAPPPDAPGRPRPVLAFASTRLGPRWVARVRDAARAFGGPQAQVRELAGYGHLDVIVGRRAARDVFAPVAAWLRHIDAPPRPSSGG